MLIPGWFLLVAGAVVGLFFGFDAVVITRLRAENKRLRAEIETIRGEKRLRAANFCLGSAWRYAHCAGSILAHRARSGSATGESRLSGPTGIMSSTFNRRARIDPGPLGQATGTLGPLGRTRTPKSPLSPFERSAPRTSITGPVSVSRRSFSKCARPNGPTVSIAWPNGPGSDPIATPRTKAQRAERWPNRVHTRDRRATPFRSDGRHVIDVRPPLAIDPGPLGQAIGTLGPLGRSKMPKNPLSL